MHDWLTAWLSTKHAQTATRKLLFIFSPALPIAVSFCLKCPCNLSLSDTFFTSFSFYLHCFFCMFVSDPFFISISFCINCTCNLSLFDSLSYGQTCEPLLCPFNSNLFLFSFYDTLVHISIFISLCNVLFTMSFKAYLRHISLTLFPYVLIR